MLLNINVNIVNLRMFMFVRCSIVLLNYAKASLSRRTS